MNARTKTMSISQVEQAPSSHVFVLNTSGGSGQPKGIINVTVTEGNGRPTVLKIPVTFIPMDLTEQATKNAILSSPDFRRLVSKGVITIITEESAAELLSSPQAQQERRRLMDVDHAHEIQENQQSAEVQSIKAEASGEIGGFALGLAHTSDGDEDALCANLRNNADSLSQAELQYIVNNSPFHKVKALAAEFIVK